MRTLLLLRLWAARNLLRLGLRWVWHPVHALIALALAALLVAFVVASVEAMRAVPFWWSRPIVVALVTAMSFQLAFGAWLFPPRTGLAFSDGEVGLVFPAPISRATVLRTRILSAQPGLLALAGLTATLVPRTEHDNLGVVVLGVHVAFTFQYLNRLAVALAMVPRPDTGRPGLVRPVVALLFAAALATVVWSFPGIELFAGISLEDLATGQDAALRTLSTRLGLWATSGPQAVILAPFRAFAELVAPVRLVAPIEGGEHGKLLAALAELQRLVRQLLMAPADLVGLVPAPGTGVLRRLWAPLVVTAIPYLYSVHGRAPFMEAALKASEAWRLHVESLRTTGTWATPTDRKLASPTMSLGLLDGTVWAIAWKNLAGITRVSPTRLAVDAALFLAILLYARTSPALRPYCLGASVTAASGAGLALMVAGEVSPYDLRSALRKRVVWFKTIPVEGWKVFLGEVLANGLIAWAGAVLSIVAWAVLAEDVPMMQLSLADRALLAASASVALLPSCVFLVAVTNAAAIAWPRVFGTFPPTGVLDVFGLYLVLFGRLFVLAVASLPGLGVGVVAGGLGAAIAWPLAAPLAALAFAAVMAFETGLVVAAAGRRLETFEPAA